MKASFKINLVFVITLIALSFITSAHATKPHFLKKPPMLLTASPSSVNKSTKTFPAHVYLAAIWNDGIIGVKYLATDQSKVWLTKNNWVDLGHFQKSHGLFASNFNIIYKDINGHDEKIVGTFISDSNNSAECIRPRADAGGTYNTFYRGRQMRIAFYKYKNNEDSSFPSNVGRGQINYLVKVGRPIVFCAYAGQDNFLLSISRYPDLGMMSVKVFFTDGWNPYYINSTQGVVFSTK